ncbi:MAG TPA: Gfo/Idh/MocA family oxidoreductase [Firmicutes bacterium]|nr:Gfo/Idh/MocA family oxidoreductase [Bacillota bacterium]
MAKPKVRIGIVGSGYAASFHAAAYRRVIETEAVITGVYSPTAANRTAFAARHHIPTVYTSLEELLHSPEVDVVDICTPNSSHAEIALAAARAGKHIIVEKVLTGYFGRGEESVGATSKAVMLEQVASSVRLLKETVTSAGVRLCYAENWVYAPSIRKADALLAASDSTILRLVGEESHSGSHSAFAKEWRTAGGGSLVNKGSHPLGAVLYLKQQEGLRKSGRPIRPRRVLAQVANLTHLPAFAAEAVKYIKTGWVDVEDWGIILLEFADGSVAQVTGADTVLGGIRNVLSIYASRCAIECNLNPNTSMLTYAPDAEVFKNEYIREKVETTAGWQFVNPDESWGQGYYDEMEDFCLAVAQGQEPLSGLTLAGDVAIVLYAAYLSAERGDWVNLEPYLND